jgi:hypothetical protein
VVRDCNHRRFFGTVVAGGLVITGRNVIVGDALHRNNSLLRQYRLTPLRAGTSRSVGAVTAGWGRALRWYGASWESILLEAL